MLFLPNGKYLCWLSNAPLAFVTATTEPSWSVSRYFKPSELQASLGNFDGTSRRS